MKMIIHTQKQLTNLLNDKRLVDKNVKVQYNNYLDMWKVIIKK